MTWHNHYPEHQPILYSLFYSRYHKEKESLMTKEATAQFIREHSKLKEGGVRVTERTTINDAGEEVVDTKRVHDQTVRTVTNNDYLTYHNELHQLTPAVVNAVAEAHREWITGKIAVGVEDLTAGIARARENGDDPTEESVSLRTTTPFGQLRVDISAQDKVNNPSTGEQIVRHGVVDVFQRTRGLIDKGAAEEARNSIRKLLTGS